MGKNIALVLGGGGARGLSHIGVIEEIERQGYNIKSIAGTSIGALIGGIYAAGKLEIFKKWITSLTKYDVYKLMEFTINLGFVKMDKVISTIKKFVGTINIEDLQIKLSIIATDLHSNEEIIFEKGDLFDAISSSIAYPTIITPYKLNNVLYVDGGIVNPLPINRVKRMKGDILVVVNLSSKLKYKKHIEKIEYSYLKKLIKSWNKSKKKKEKWSYIKIIDESLNTMHTQLIKLTLKLYKPDILIKISKDCAGFFDYYNAKELIIYGGKQTKYYLKKTNNDYDNKI